MRAIVIYIGTMIAFAINPELVGSMLHGWSLIAAIVGCGLADLAELFNNLNKK